jgi:hypothetical protein
MNTTVVSGFILALLTNDKGIGVQILLISLYENESWISDPVGD